MMNDKTEAIKRARQLLDDSEQLSKRSAGSCLNCRWMNDPDISAGISGTRLYQRQCLHPIVSPVKLDVESGAMEVYGAAELISNARSSYGLCGIDGTLWEPRRPWQYPLFWVGLAVLVPAIFVLAMTGVFP